MWLFMAFRSIEVGDSCDYSANCRRNFMNIHRSQCALSVKYPNHFTRGIVKRMYRLRMECLFFCSFPSLNPMRSARHFIYPRYYYCCHQFRWKTNIFTISSKKLVKIRFNQLYVGGEWWREKRQLWENADKNQYIILNWTIGKEIMCTNPPKCDAKRHGNCTRICFLGNMHCPNPKFDNKFAIAICHYHKCNNTISTNRLNQQHATRDRLRRNHTRSERNRLVYKYEHV